MSSNVETMFYRVTGDLTILCCPRCGVVVDLDSEDYTSEWPEVIRDEDSQTVDVICPDCVTLWDVARADRDEIVPGGCDLPEGIVNGRERAVLQLVELTGIADRFTD